MSSVGINGVQAAAASRYTMTWSLQTTVLQLSGSVDKYLLLPYPSLAHSGADKEDVEPRGDGGAVRSSPSNSRT